MPAVEAKIAGDDSPKIDYAGCYAALLGAAGDQITF
jgi:hypothetical protein